MARKRKTRSTSTSSGDVVIVAADSNSGDTKTKSAKKTRSSSSSSSDAQKKSRKKTNLDTASSAVETKQSTETVPIKVDGNNEEDEVSNSRFLGDPVPDEEAKQRWPKRYQEKEKKSTGSRSNSDDEVIIRARYHYTEAEVDGGVIYKLFDDAHVQGEKGGDHYICKIVEMFEAIDGELYFTAQWYYRAKDTAIKDLGYLIESKRVFFSEVQDDNPLDCLVEKLNIARLQLHVDFGAIKEVIPPCNYYCDTLYLLPYCTFVKLPSETIENGSESSSTISSEIEVKGRSEVNSNSENAGISEERKEPELKLLDLYSGCGAMSTGLCQGGILSGSNIVTKWAVDLNEHACQSLKLNHPETEVRNESAEIFLSLLKEWEKLCCYFSLIDSNVPHDEYSNLFGVEEEEADGTDCEESNNEEIFEVSEVHHIRYAEANKENKPGLYFKVSWKGYKSDADSWEPVDGLSNCKERIKDFVIRGFKSNILPLPGYVDVVCGGPPCQGISGFNRFRNNKNPLEDEKNRQLVVFMDIVRYLRPRYTLMENVVDLVKFSHGFLGRYALGRLVQMKYQCRLGIMAAGAYGLPQFRLRVFIWGAAPSEKLPQFPLPTHDVIVRGFIPVEFEGCTVAYNEGHTVQLQNKLILQDAISDLPSIENSETRDEIEYGDPPHTEFQRFIRLSKNEMLGTSNEGTSNEMKSSKSLLHDHRPLKLNTDDYQRVCRIPKRKGACFRDLPCVRVRDNIVELNPDVKREYLDSGKPLVPNYAISFVGGTSPLPFARLWWDETVPTVVTRAEPHNQKILHPEQDRVLSIRENARLQGFPDFYKLCGPVKQRYMQVGNAVAVPVARALGYSLGLAFQGASVDGPLYTLPDKFPKIGRQVSSVPSEEVA